ncbi:hypothetical protein KUIN1_40080 [Pseudomonas sp. KUIN-1]|nr:hypothetical protein KUIN1_40080 [Pseudomonas sp. KUIN-1]
MRTLHFGAWILENKWESKHTVTFNDDSFFAAHSGTSVLTNITSEGSERYEEAECRSYMQTRWV